MNFKKWCWRCARLTNEWLGIKIYISRKGKCFCCRIDALDKKYGPSQLAKQYKSIRGNYNTPADTLWEQKKYKLAFKLLLK